MIKTYAKASIVFCLMISRVADERVKPDSTLRKVGALMGWQRLAAVLGPTRSRR